MNACFGDPSDKTLPFDLGHLRHPITYDCADDANDATRQEQRAKLAARLSEALKLILALGKKAIAQDAEFVPKTPEGGPGRFRNPVQPIGHLHGGEGVTTGQTNPQRVWLPHGASMWLRVMPRNPLPESLLSPRIEAALRTDSRLVEPLNFYHSNIRLQPVRDRDGFGVCGFLGREEMPAAVVYVFLSGEIWSIDTARLASEISYICFDESAFSAALVAFSAVLGRLDIAAPYRWIAGMEGVRGRSLRIPGQGLGPMPPASQAASNVIEVQGTFSGIDADAKHSLEPFFRQVFGNHHLIRPMPLTGTQNSAPR